MPKQKRKTVTETLIDFALADPKEHQALMATLPAEKLAAVIGRKGRLTVEGDEGGVFIIKLTPYGVFPDNSDEDIRNDIWMTYETFEAIVLRELNPKVARARGQVLFTGDRSLYDAAEIMDVCEKWMLTKIAPIAQKLVRAMGGKRP